MSGIDRDAGRGIDLDAYRTSVAFHTANALEERLFHEAERKCLANVRDFAGRDVLVEGAGYEKVWLETQPMGGEMYAKRNIEVGLNNQLVFMDCQRDDGRLPGAIERLPDGSLEPQYRQFQGFCFAGPALNMYYLTGRDGDYLHRLYGVLKRFDAYMWATRDSDGDGCLEAWCQYDTGEDHAMRFRDAPLNWPAAQAPEGFEAVPIASMDFMGYSYASRATLSRICRIAGHLDESVTWQRRADEVLRVMRDYLWDDARGAYFDRDRRHRVMPELIHNTLRTMYWGAIAPDMAERFVDEHLTNPEEFWTPMPLPSVAVNDPLFRNVRTNNWSGQAEALTYQRAIAALERYGYHRLIPVLGERLMRAIGPECVFVQQYDPFTGEPSICEGQGGSDAYGPAMLSVLEYCACMHGVRIAGERVLWGSYGDAACEYEQTWGERRFALHSDGTYAEGSVDGRRVFRVPVGTRVVTDYTGSVLRADSLL